jgi:hypothetical protein
VTADTDAAVLVVAVAEYSSVVVAAVADVAVVVVECEDGERYGSQKRMQHRELGLPVNVRVLCLRSCSVIRFY